MVVDDLPWPELGNVSRGATRGNQGQKGVVSRPDQDGRCVLQVQAGVLTCLLNRQASDWYRTLVHEVNQALKLTKTHWRKARRRQDYDAQADQEHMELHEWLQQLKDKVMQHLELLMQRGDIKGPPYIMPDDLELTFLRKFIERQQAGIPHNPRLREAFLQGRLPAQQAPIPSTSRSGSDGPGTQGSDSGWGDEDAPARDPVPAYGLPSVATMTTPNAGKVVGHAGTLEEQLTASAHHLQAARVAYRRAQKTTSDVFTQYTAALEAERNAAREVALHEYRRDALVAAVIQDGSQTTQQHQHADDAFQQPRRYSYSAEQDLARFSQWNTNGVRSHAIEHAAPLPATYRWESDERSNLPSGSHTSSPRMAHPGPALMAEENGADARKRVWDAEEAAQLEPPRKRSNHGSLVGSPAMATTLSAHVMGSN